jgi:hypothetical protein
VSEPPHIGAGSRESDRVVPRPVPHRSHRLRLGPAPLEEVAPPLSLRARHCLHDSHGPTVLTKRLYLGQQSSNIMNGQSPIHPHTTDTPGSHPTRYAPSAAHGSHTRRPRPQRFRW